MLHNNCYELKILPTGCFGRILLYFGVRWGTPYESWKSLLKTLKLHKKHVVCNTYVLQEIIIIQVCGTNTTYSVDIYRVKYRICWPHFVHFKNCRNITNSIFNCLILGLSLSPKMIYKKEVCLISNATWSLMDTALKPYIVVILLCDFSSWFCDNSHAFIIKIWLSSRKLLSNWVKTKMKLSTVNFIVLRYLKCTKKVNTIGYLLF